MAPDADKLRQRKKAVSSVDKETKASNQVIRTFNLKSTEVCIDGVVYDISTFEHPGGDSIQLFGGNDVTVQYKMIHPYHTHKHLQRMKCVGKVIDYTTEYVFTITTI